MKVLVEPSSLEAGIIAPEGYQIVLAYHMAVAEAGHIAVEDRIAVE